MHEWNSILPSYGSMAKFHAKLSVYSKFGILMDVKTCGILQALFRHFE